MWLTIRIARHMSVTYVSILFCFIPLCYVISNTNEVKKKVKFSLKQVRKAQRGSRGTALLFPLPQRWMGVGGQRHVPVALLPGKTR